MHNATLIVQEQENARFKENCGAIQCANRLIKKKIIIKIRSISEQERMIKNYPLTL